jgi:hypothetical protein
MAGETMRKLASSVLAFVLAALPAAGTVDHWATTYHVVPGEEGEGLMVMPIQFLTYHASPWTEINAVSDPNHLDLRGNSTTQNANLVSLYGIKVRVLDHSSTTGTVVLIDLSKLQSPTNLMNRVGTQSKEAVVGCAVECVILAATKATRGRLEIRIEPPAGEHASTWRKFARVVDLKRENER